MTSDQIGDAYRRKEQKTKTRSFKILSRENRGGSSKLRPPEMGTILHA